MTVRPSSARSRSCCMTDLSRPGSRPEVGSSRNSSDGLGQQFQGDVDPLALAAGEPVERASRACLARPSSSITSVTRALRSAGRGVGGEAQLGGVLQRAADGQLGVQDVVLRDQADAVPQLGVVLVQVAVVVEDGARVRGPHARHRAEQGGLACAARADDADQAFLRQREGHPVEQHLAARHRHHEVLRRDGDLAGRRRTACSRRRRAGTSRARCRRCRRRSRSCADRRPLR